MAEKRHTALVPLSCVLGHQVGSCDTLPLPSPSTAAPTGVCSASSAVQYVCDLSAVGLGHAGDMAFPCDRPCVCQRQSYLQLTITSADPNHITVYMANAFLEFTHLIIIIFIICDP